MTCRAFGTEPELHRGCLTGWPAPLAAGDTPTGAPGVTGTLGTITRADHGTLQVTN